MNKIEILLSNSLFEGVSEAEFLGLQSRLVLRPLSFQPREIIAFEGDLCEVIGFLLNGKIYIQKNDFFGNGVILDRVGPGDSFGEVIAFSDHGYYPASVVNGDQVSVIVFITKKDFMDVCLASPTVLQNFMKILSNKILKLNQKIALLSLRTIRQKIIFTILEESKKQNTDLIELPFNRQEWAELLNIPRPSLSRELGSLRDEGMIEFSGRCLVILNRASLESGQFSQFQN